MQSYLPDKAPELGHPRPLHVGVIMDGNGRWAARRGLPRYFGHRRGAEAIRRLVEAAPSHGVGALTLFAFSAENWRRPASEIAALMGLLRQFLTSEVGRLKQAGARLRVIGRRDRLRPEIVEAIEQAEAATAAGEALLLRIAVDYSARDALLDAAARAQGVSPLTRELFARLLADEPVAREVDLVIRTSGEQRLSDFLLWESAYAELHFVERLWPDFTPEDFAHAMDAFARRERRFGGVAAQTGRV